MSENKDFDHFAISFDFTIFQYRIRQFSGIVPDKTVSETETSFFLQPSTAPIKVFSVGNDRLGVLAFVPFKIELFIFREFTIT